MACVIYALPTFEKLTYSAIIRQKFSEYWPNSVIFIVLFWFFYREKERETERERDRDRERERDFTSSGDIQRNLTPVYLPPHMQWLPLSRTAWVVL